MKAVGLITEYNPFHNGHIHHIQEAKKITQADVVIAVMSGNFVQRGEPAITDKWKRTQAALKNGVDLVFELPFFYAVQPSHIFADGAIKLLADLKIESLVFGSEHPDVDFIEIAKQAPDTTGTKNFKYNETFASQYSESLFKKTGFQLEQPNDILAFGYANAVVNNHLENQIKLFPIERKAADYHDQTPNDDSITSATAIRKLVANRNDYQQFTPMNDLQPLDYQINYWQLLYYRLMTDTTGQLKQIYQMNEGLENNLKTAAEKSSINSLDDLIREVKNKHLTYARLQRTLTYTLMNIKVDQMQAALSEPYLRLLGYNQIGQQYLNQIKKEISYPMVTHVDSAIAKKQLRMDYRAGILFNQLYNLSQPQDLGRIPITDNEN